MRFDDVMEKLAPVVGLTSLIGAPESVRSGGAKGVEVTLGGAREALAHASHQQNNARSDAAYWGYQGQVSYWRAVVSLLEATEITGRDHLPDVPMPDLSNRVVMDATYLMEQWAESVLAAAQAGSPNAASARVIEPTNEANEQAN